MSIAEISELIGLIATGAGLIVAIIGWVKTVIKNIKEKKLEQLTKQFMAEAEVKYSDGKERQAYVVMKVTEYFKNTSVAMIEKIEKYIKECIDFSKKVNYKEGK